MAELVHVASTTAALDIVAPHDCDGLVIVDGAFDDRDMGAR